MESVIPAKISSSRVCFAAFLSCFFKVFFLVKPLAYLAHASMSARYSAPELFRKVCSAGPSLSATSLDIVVIEKSLLPISY